MHSKAHYFNLGGKGVRTSGKEAIQSLYNLTLCLNDDKGKMSEPLWEITSSKASVTEASFASTVDDNYKKRGHKSLSSFTTVEVTDSFLSSHKGETPMISHLRVNDNVNKGIAWMDGDKIAAYVSVSTPSKSPTSNEWGDYRWITALEVAPKYQGYGLSDQVLKYAMNRLRANALGVDRKNEVAIKLYEKYGFKISEEDSTDKNLIMYK